MQASVQFPISSPPPLTGAALTAALNAAFGTVLTLCASAVAPTSGTLGFPTAGIVWHDLSTGNVNIRNQADTAWLLWGNINETLGSITPPNPFGVSLSTSSSGTYQLPAYGVKSVFVSAGTATGLVQLPVGFPANFAVDVFKTDNSANTVTVSASGGQLINGAASVSVTGSFAKMSIRIDPTGAFAVKS